LIANLILKNVLTEIINVAHGILGFWAKQYECSWIKGTKVIHEAISLVLWRLWMSSEK